MMLYSIADISKMTKIPESTLRHYRNQFIEFLPSTGKGRSRRYYEEAVPIFRRISELKSEGYTQEQVHLELSGEATQYHDVNLPAIPDAQEKLLEALLESRKEQDKLQGQVALMREELGEIRRILVKEKPTLKEKMKQFFG